VIGRFDFTLRFATPDIGWQALMLSRWCVADARVERCKAKQSRRGKDGADV